MNLSETYFQPLEAMTTEDKADLLRQALSGDAAALDRLVALLTPVIHARVTRTLLARRFRLAGGRDVREEVKDLSQEVFLALFERNFRVLRDWKPERGLSLENFVGLVAKCQVLSFLRSSRRNPWPEDPSQSEYALGVEAEDPGPEEIVASREHLALLLDRLYEELSPLGWRMFELLFVQYLSQAEVEAVSGLSADAVYAWRSRLRDIARKLEAELSGNAGPERRT
jgi:RNA polymerase sigma-70 factor (ECF subfamily)